MLRNWKTGHSLVLWTLCLTAGFTPACNQSAPNADKASAPEPIARATAPAEEKQPTAAAEAPEARAFDGDNAAKPKKLPFGGGSRGLHDESGENQAGKGSLGVAPGSPLAPPPPPTTVNEAAIAIDPNGRFATTYRPGSGHLSSFEASVARGIIPAAEKELVSDVGARYVTGFEVPQGKSLGVKVDMERGKLPPAGSPFHVRVTLKSSPDKPKERPHLSVHLVLDVSGSMQGESIQQARTAAQALVDKLAPTDDFSLVTFSSDAEVRIPDGPVGSRRDSIKKTISEIKEGGGTNISRGLELGYQQAQTKSIPTDAVKVVLLLSDGRANSGILSAAGMSKLALDAFQDGIQTSTFGLGAEYDGALMSTIESI